MLKRYFYGLMNKLFLCHRINSSLVVRWRWLILVTFFFSHIESNAQNSTNYIELTALTPLVFTCNTAASLEANQTLPSALMLELATKAKSCIVSAKLSSYTAPAGFQIPSVPLALQYVYDTSPATTQISTQPINLQSYDQQLFTSTKLGSSYYYFYSLTLKPVGYSYPPGTYNFVITFTMTQP